MKTEYYLSPEQLPEIIEELQTAALIGGYRVTVEKTKKRRTNQQNRALHQYCKIIAGKLQSAGTDQKALLTGFNDNLRLPCQPDVIKDIFREIGRLMYGVESTAELSTTQIQEVYLIFDKKMSEAHGISSAWPSQETLYY